jgi:hypothetical protein
MMIINFRSFYRSLAHNIVNIPGWRTARRIVVIESDDWGSIRMPSLEVLKQFQSKGYDLARSDYNRLDTLESNDDLSELFEVLSSFRDARDNHPAFTANVVVGNPDFRRIRESDFNKYYFEPVTETLRRYPGRDLVKSLWQKGMEEGVFLPQFHGREHVNVVRWMEALRERNPEMMFTFDNETTFSGDGDYNYMEVLDYNSQDDLHLMKESLTEGLDIFENLFGFRSVSFIPPCYTWDSGVEETLSRGGVKYIQGLVIQQVPTGRFGHYKRKYHYSGSRNAFGQHYLIRNCFFEPSLSANADEVDNCLARIAIAFRWHKPAIISSHRINYIGAIDSDNRSNNLKRLKQLLKTIIRKWPDVEFITTDKLGNLIVNDDNTGLYRATRS